MQGEASATAMAPAGVLRVGLIEAPAAGVLFIHRGKGGEPRGVTVDLSNELARLVGVPLAITILPNSGEATDAVHTGKLDVSFMPVDDVRRALVDFGPGYYELESTYLVNGASAITDVAQVDREGLRIVAIEGTTTMRASSRTLRFAQPRPVPSVAEAVGLMRSGEADAFALSRDSLRSLVIDVPGSCIVTGGFQRTLVAVAVPKDRPEALAGVTAWLQAAKATGFVRRTFDAHGLASETVAP